MEKGQKLYKVGEYGLLEYKFIKKSGKSYIIEDINGVYHTISAIKFNDLCLSKIIALSEEEERLSNKLDYIHELMRQHKINFNPTVTFETIYVYESANAKSVHQYTMEGEYINFYPNAQAATKAVKGPDMKRSNRISQACNGKTSSAYGFRWSYKKLKKLE